MSNIDLIESAVSKDFETFKELVNEKLNKKAKEKLEDSNGDDEDGEDDDDEDSSLEESKMETYEVDIDGSFKTVKASSEKDAIAKALKKGYSSSMQKELKQKIEFGKIKPKIKKAIDEDNLTEAKDDYYVAYEEDKKGRIIYIWAVGDDQKRVMNDAKDEIRYNMDGDEEGYKTSIKNTKVKKVSKSAVDKIEDDDEYKYSKRDFDKLVKM